MEIRDGFIDGVHNYCDRWCETCAFTTWCRLFADSARHDATDDPNLKPVVDAPPLPHEVEPEPATMDAGARRGRGIRRLRDCQP